MLPPVVKKEANSILKQLPKYNKQDGKSERIIHRISTQKYVKKACGEPQAFNFNHDKKRLLGVNFLGVIVVMEEVMRLLAERFAEVVGIQLLYVRIEMRHAQHTLLIIRIDASCA